MTEGTPSPFLRLAEACERIAATSKRTEKVAALAELLRAAPLDEAAATALLLSGRVFAAHEETTLQVGGALLWKAVRAVAGVADDALGEAYRRHGDLGDAAFDALSAREGAARGSPGVLEVQAELRAVGAARGPAAKLARVEALLGRVSPLEARYLVKMMTGDLRIGLKQAQVEEAIAAAFGAGLDEVQRADMLLGDVGAALRLAAEGRLGEARMRLFHPLGSMLATAADSAAEAFESSPAAQVEDKYDGIRAQAHCRAEGHAVRVFSRTRDDVTSAFPELALALGAFSEDVILDGEVLAWEGGAAGSARPFAALQKRLGRKRVTAALMREVPVAFVAFDVLYARGELLLDLPLRERAAILDDLFAERRPVRAPERRGQLGLFGDPDRAPDGLVLRAPAAQVGSAAHLEALFDAARARGNEGLMVKDPESPYVPGRRGRAWLKLKRELATLDVVVTRVEHGHGKRAGVLSDYTFAVRDGDRLLDLGKAYTGLTDAELAELDGWFRAHTLADRGHQRDVEPTLVLEVAFNNLMRSERHASGYALRFPRIVRVRTDKSVEDIATLDEVRALFARAGG